MPLLFVVLYSLLSGFFDVLPVSSLAHQAVLQEVFGVDGPLHLFNLFMHLGSLGALVFASFSSLSALFREQKMLSLPRRKIQGERKFTYELRFVKASAVSIVISTIALLFLRNITNNILLIGVLCIVNGAIVLVPEYVPVGNKTAKHMNQLDAVAFGLLGGLGVFSGISRIASMQCYASLRGVDRSRACNWALLTAIPAIAVLAFADLLGIFTAGIESISFLTFLSYLLGTGLCFVATFGGVTLIRFLSAKVGFVGFGYYSIGVGLFTFFLYLTV